MFKYPQNEVPLHTDKLIFPEFWMDQFFQNSGYVHHSVCSLWLLGCIVSGSARGCAADAMPSVFSKLVVILPISEG